MYILRTLVYISCADLGAPIRPLLSSSRTLRALDTKTRKRERVTVASLVNTTTTTDAGEEKKKNFSGTRKISAKRQSVEKLLPAETKRGGYII